eukprot:c22293_g1_i1 orf=686-3412(+)
MGIFRAGVRVTRALTPTPSSSSSDDEEPRAKKCKTRKSSEKVAYVGAHHSVNESVTGLFQVGQSTCQLPEELFALSHLGEVLSLQTWNNCLTEEERQSLCAYLPDMDRESYTNTLKGLFSGQNMHFGSPLEDLWQSLKEGSCDPEVVQARQTLMVLQRKDYHHGLRQYHNGMVNSLVEMRELWASDPEANLEERLSSWNAWKSSEAHTEVSERLRADRLTTRPFSGRTGAITNNGMARIGRSECDAAHRMHNNSGDLFARGASLGMCRDSELAQDFEDSKIQTTPLATASLNRCEANGIDGTRRRAHQEPNIQRKREFPYRDIGHGMPALEPRIDFGKSQVKAKFMPSIKAQKAHTKIQHGSKHDRHVKRHNREVKAPSFSDSEDAPLVSRKQSQHDGYKDMGFKSSDTMAVREPSTGGTHYKKCANRQFSSSSQQDWGLDDFAKPLKRGDTTLVPPATPGFSFSILHLFSAVRATLVDQLTPEGSEIECLPFREIVSRVESCPGDPQILEVQLPLDGLVKGVLKILSSTSKKLAMDGFQPFALYDKDIRCWSWIGPVPGYHRSLQEVDVHSLPEVWNTSALILQELQDIFGKWLKNTEKTLQQLWQLALLPRPAFPVLPDEKERFKDLRAQKSLTTIFPSSHEMRALFRKEERVRYSALEIAFCYTTGDGHKAAVAPLRRMGGKSKAKARDHFMLKPDRPSHITILCLVRDAAARLPQGIGTRADVCILLRDSQFIVEDVPEVQLSQVVSGALDRLHYERDPCVRYDPDKKLWLYLHGDREEEDFEEGGTTSTRSSRRSKKDGADAAVSPAQGNGYHDDMSEAEPDSGSFNGHGGARESASPELLYDHQIGGPSSMVPGAVGGQVREEVLLPFIDLPPSMQPFCGNMQSHPMGWEVYKAGKELSITQ